MVQRFKRFKRFKRFNFLTSLNIKKASAVTDALRAFYWLSLMIQLTVPAVAPVVNFQLSLQLKGVPPVS